MSRNIDTRDSAPRTSLQTLLNEYPSYSITPGQLCEYWHNQLYQQNPSIRLNMTSEPTFMSEKSIEPWMLWMPTKKECGYQKVNLVHSNKSVNVVNYQVPNPAIINNNSSKNVSLKEKKIKMDHQSRHPNDYDPQMCKNHQHYWNSAQGSKARKKLKQGNKLREENDLVEYKKRFGLIAMTTQDACGNVVVRFE